MPVVWNYRKARETADRIDKLIHERCKRIALEAGIDPSIYPIHAHNALVGLHYGQPWAGVDYSLVRKIEWLTERRWHVNRLLEAYAHRHYFDQGFFAIPVGKP